MAENFDLIFGQNASQQYAWNDTDYLNGWETIGNIPPTAAQFDALQRRSDTKMKELNDELTPLVNADTADTRQPSTSYNVDDIKYSPLLPTGWYLLCTTGGTTSAGDLVIASPTVGATVTDGGVVWTIREMASTADIPAPVDISGKANVSLNNLSAAGLALIQQQGGGIIAQNIATNGYIKFDNGLIMQWGEVKIPSSGGEYSWTFPISFTTACYYVAGFSFRRSDGSWISSQLTYRTLQAQPSLSQINFSSGSGWGDVSYRYILVLGK